MDGGQKDNPAVSREQDGNLDILVDKKILYHGSNVPQISQFDLDKEVDDSVGRGIYFTPDDISARKYAIRRADKRGGSPIVYKTETRKIKVANLAIDDNVKRVLVGFRNILNNKLKDSSKWFDVNSYTEAIHLIDTNQIHSGNLKNVTSFKGLTFTDYLKSLGYDGLIAREGGEPSVDPHESWVIFDPSKVKIVEEQVI